MNEQLPSSDTDLGLVPDTILVERSVDGDTAAFATLLTRHAPLMRAYVARIVGSQTDADDVLQEVFQTAWKHLPELRDRAAVRAWMMRVASRHAFRYLRQKSAEAPMPVTEFAQPPDTQPENVVIRNAQLVALGRALDKLPEDQRQCWLLREIGELSYDDIAAELDLPRASVRGRIARARANIYTQMEEWR